MHPNKQVAEFEVLAASDEGKREIRTAIKSGLRAVSQLPGYTASDLYAEGLLCAYRVATQSRAPVGSQQFYAQLQIGTRRRVIDIMRKQMNREATIGRVVSMAPGSSLAYSSGSGMSRDAYVELVGLLQRSVRKIDKPVLDVILQSIEDFEGVQTTTSIARAARRSVSSVRRSLVRLRDLFRQVGFTPVLAGKSDD